MLLTIKSKSGIEHVVNTNSKLSMIKIEEAQHFLGTFVLEEVQMLRRRFDAINAGEYTYDPVTGFKYDDPELNEKVDL